VAHRFVMFDLRPTNVQGARFLVRGTRPSTGGAGGQRWEVLCLLVQELFHRALGQSLGGGHGHLFHGIQVNVQAGPLFAEGPAGDNFSPLFGQLLNRIQIFLVESSSSHDESFLGVRENEPLDQHTDCTSLNFSLQSGSWTQ